MRTTGVSSARSALPLLLFGLALLGVQACGGSRFIYVIDTVVTLPTEADDKPGIWFDAERGTPGRPLSKPVRGAHLRLNRHLADPDESQPQDPMLAQAYTDSYGCISLVGEVELDDGDTVELIMERKGYKTLKRSFQPTEMRDASMTIVVRKLPGSFDPVNDVPKGKKAGAKSDAPPAAPAKPAPAATPGG